jgi:hypothetical protein
MIKKRPSIQSRLLLPPLRHRTRVGKYARKEKYILLLIPYIRGERRFEKWVDRDYAMQQCGSGTSLKVVGWVDSAIYEGTY